MNYNFELVKMYHEHVINKTPLIDKNMFNESGGWLFNETYYGGNPLLEEIDSCFQKLKEKDVSKFNPNGSKEIKTIEANLAELFGFENAYLTVVPNKTMNACTVPFFYELKAPERKDFEIVRTANGIKYKNPKNKSLYVYVNSYAIEMCTPRECTALVLHEVGHNFYAVEDFYKYARTNIIRSYLLQAISNIVLGIPALVTGSPNLLIQGLTMLVDLYQYCKSPQRYNDRMMKSQLGNYKLNAKEPGAVGKFFIKLGSLIGGIVGVAAAPMVILMLTPAVIISKISYKFLHSTDEHGYLQEKFSDDFASSYGYATEVANIFKHGRTTSYRREYLKDIPILNLLESINDAVYNSTTFLTDCHPQRHQRCVNALNKLKFELDRNKKTLKPYQIRDIEEDIKKLEEIIKESNKHKDPITKLLTDKLNLANEKDKYSHDTITDEILFDFEKEIFDDKH